MQPITVAQTFFVQRSDQRGHADHGWLQARHSFSFAEYYDPRNVNWGALRVLNDDTIAAGQGFPTHPHRDMEIITYVLSGELEHRDSAGNHGVVGPGGVQFMSAGTGIRHSEYNHSQTQSLHLLQMWVLPGKMGVPPSYGQHAFSKEDRLGRLLPVASGRPGERAPVSLTQDAAFFVTRLEQGASPEYAFAPNRLGFLFLAEGEATVEARTQSGDVIGRETLTGGDAVRMASIPELRVQGTGELVLWDIPRLPDDAND